MDNVINKYYESNIIKNIDWEYELKRRLEKSVYFFIKNGVNSLYEDGYTYNYFSNVFGDITFSKNYKKYKDFHSRLERVEKLNILNNDFNQRTNYENRLFYYLEEFNGMGMVDWSDMDD